MRKIKFRFYDKINNEMWYQEDLAMIIIDEEGVISPLYDSGGEFKDVEKPENIITMEFTGRLDINDKEVYQGDIVKVIDNYYDDREPFVGYVDFSDCSFIIRDECITHYRWMDFEVEVIGNIYENEELL